jgi:drug/metabolite transporter (DMT)-like permease
VSGQRVLFLTVLLWGSTFAITRDLLRDVPPLVYLSARFVIGGALLAGWVWAGRGPRVASSVDPSIRGMGRSAILLGLLQGGGLLLQVIGQVYTTASKSAFLTALCVPLTPILGLLLRGDRPRAQQVAAVSVGAAGLLLLTYPAAGFSWNPGDLLTLGAAALFAVAIVETTHRARGRDALALAAVQTLLCAALFLLGLALVRLAPSIWPAELLRLEARPAQWSGKVLLQGAYMAVVCTALTFGMQTWALARMSAIESAVIFALEPVVAMIVALLAFGGDEWPGTRGAIGAAMVLLAVLGAEVPLSRLSRLLARGARG